MRTQALQIIILHEMGKKHKIHKVPSNIVATEPKMRSMNNSA